MCHYIYLYQNCILYLCVDSNEEYTDQKLSLLCIKEQCLVETRDSLNLRLVGNLSLSKSKLTVTPNFLSKTSFFMDF